MRILGTAADGSRPAQGNSPPDPAGPHYFSPFTVLFALAYFPALFDRIIRAAPVVVVIGAESFLRGGGWNRETYPVSPADVAGFLDRWATLGHVHYSPRAPVSTGPVAPDTDTLQSGAAGPVFFGG